MTETLFLDKPISYWLEVQRRLDAAPDGFQAQDLLNELIVANSKVHYYELMLDRLSAYRAATK